MITKELEYSRKYRATYPWRARYYSAKNRCTNKRSPNYKKYGAKGIKLLMTIEEFELIWFRDKAYLMGKPSIDRIDSKSNYILSNCRFIEHKENSSRNSLPSKPILQFTIGGKFIKEWASVSEAIVKGCFNKGNLYLVLAGKRRNAGGYFFKYKKSADDIPIEIVIRKRKVKSV